MLLFIKFVFNLILNTFLIYISLFLNLPNYYFIFYEILPLLYINILFNLLLNFYPNFSFYNYHNIYFNINGFFHSFVIHLLILSYNYNIFNLSLNIHPYFISLFHKHFNIYSIKYYHILLILNLKRLKRKNSFFLKMFYVSFLSNLLSNFSLNVYLDIYSNIYPNIYPYSFNIYSFHFYIIQILKFKRLKRKNLFFLNMFDNFFLSNLLILKWSILIFTK